MNVHMNLCICKTTANEETKQRPFYWKGDKAGVITISGFNKMKEILLMGELAVLRVI